MRVRGRGRARGRGKGRILDIKVVLRPDGGIGHPQHIHRLARLPDRGVDVGARQGEEGLRDAEDELRDVKGPEDVLGAKEGQVSGRG